MGLFKDLSGMNFNKLTVIDRAPDKISKDGRHRTAWNCKCECGEMIVITSDALLSGNQVSCGCYKKKKLSDMTTTHGKTNTRLYSVWNGIKGRCTNKNMPEYCLYGGRGITICEEWRSNFMSFYTWAIENGYDENAQRGVYTVDRIDVNGPYSPENCRLATQMEQMQNTRKNHNIEYNGEVHSIAEWSRITGIRSEKIRNRVSKLGWSPERALTTI